MASVSLFVLFLFSHPLMLHSAAEGLRYPKKCPPFPCGNLQLTTFPFTNINNPECGVFHLDCEVTDAWIKLKDDGRLYQVLSIFQDNTLLIFDEVLSFGLENRTCKSLTNLSFPNSSFFSFELVSNKTFFMCNHTLHVSLPPDFRTMPCGDSVLYYNPLYESFPHALSECSIIQLPRNWGLGQNPLPKADNPFSLATAEVSLKVHVTSECYKCFYEEGQCKVYSDGQFYCEGAKKGNHKLIVMLLALGALCVGVVVVLVIICYFKRRFLKESLTHQTIQAFLRDHGPSMIKQYDYLDIKKITNSFENKLGEGGYGGVYKGKLQDGRLVAVKILKESKGNGEEFINEVASISKTSHVNIVSLMGFCFEGSKRALIYEFMHNGSLEKFIYKKNTSNDIFQLAWKTIYNIALGVARGLEYLHGGCNTQILHFDIKPNNILLDENFCPKISDFGLTKICPREKSVISMLGARGTIGYIAPEVFCRSFGGVSHKSDVYSYGMLIFEMIGGRRNIEVDVDRTSEIFFPHWIYKRLEQDETLGLQNLINEKDHQSARNMIIVGLWCIQTDPSNRPSMSRVINMLEGLELLEVPPKPFLSSPPRLPSRFPSKSPENSSTITGSLHTNFVIT